MRHFCRRRVLAAIAATALTTPALMNAAVAHEHRVATDFLGLALNGYDPVAYFQGKAVKGSMQFEIVMGGATWRFANEENMRQFARWPKRFAPRFGGYCAFAVTKAKARRGDPEHWDVVDGQLYLTESARAQAKWREDPSKNIEVGMEGWKQLIERCEDLSDCPDPR